MAEDLPTDRLLRCPCVTACAIKQDIPEYIRLLGEHRYADALELIYNATLCPPLPVIFAITSANTTVPAWITTVR